RALPDRVDGGLPVEAGSDRLLEVAVAAEALEGLGGCRGAPLADPVLAGGGADALDPALVFVGAGMIAGVGEAQHQGGGGFGLEGKVRQDVAHEGLVRQLPAEGAAVRGMVR